MNSNTATVFIIEDERIICEALTYVFASVCLSIEIYANAKDFLAAYDPKRVGCILLDVRMPQMSGLELQEELNARNNQLPIIFMTGHGDVPMAVRAMKAGAFDFIIKPFNNQVLLDQVQRAIALQPKLQDRMHFQELLQTLTPREKEVLKLVVDGKMNKQIAHILEISISTVELYRSHVMNKLKADSLAELVKKYLYYGQDAKRVPL